jgi:hypothetical protein
MHDSCCADPAGDARAVFAQPCARSTLSHPTQTSLRSRKPTTDARPFMDLASPVRVGLDAERR